MLRVLEQKCFSAGVSSGAEMLSAGARYLGTMASNAAGTLGNMVYDFKGLVEDGIKFSKETVSSMMPSMPSAQEFKLGGLNKIVTLMVFISNFQLTLADENFTADECADAADAAFENPDIRMAMNHIGIDRETFVNRCQTHSNSLFNYISNNLAGMTPSALQGLLFGQTDGSGQASGTSGTTEDATRAATRAATDATQAETPGASTSFFTTLATTVQNMFSSQPTSAPNDASEANDITGLRATVQYTVANFTTDPDEVSNATNAVDNAINEIDRATEDPRSTLEHVLSTVSTAVTTIGEAIHEYATSSRGDDANAPSARPDVVNDIANATTLRPNVVNDIANATTLRPDVDGRPEDDNIMTPTMITAAVVGAITLALLTLAVRRFLNRGKRPEQDGRAAEEGVLARVPSVKVSDAPIGESVIDQEIGRVSKAIVDAATIQSAAPNKLTFAEIANKVDAKQTSAEFGNLHAGVNKLDATWISQKGLKSKNRYANILPGETSAINRDVDGWPQTGYQAGDENIPLKEGGILHNMQGPLPHTGRDMASHIYDVGKKHGGQVTDVMVTNVQEKKKDSYGRIKNVFKCASYLPFPCDSGVQQLPGNAELSDDGKTLTYTFEDRTKLQIVRTNDAPIEKTIISEAQPDKPAQSFDKHSFTMKKLNADGSQIEAPVNLTFYKYQTWPDHGCPDNVSEFAGVIKNMPEPERKALIIHCSAGIGRTGVVTTLLHIDEELKDRKRHQKKKEQLLNLQ